MFLAGEKCAKDSVSLWLGEISSGLLHVSTWDLWALLGFPLGSLDYLYVNFIQIPPNIFFFNFRIEFDLNIGFYIPIIEA